MIYILIALSVVVVFVIVLSSSPEGLLLLVSLGLIGTLVLDLAYKAAVSLKFIGPIIGVIVSLVGGFWFLLLYMAPFVYWLFCIWWFG